ncbi:MAG: HAD family hydrolase [Beijerinckiaceae bacterium]
MMPPNFKNTVVTVDLDDTLYAEIDYYRSGVRAVCREIAVLFGRDIEPALLDYEAEGGRDLWTEACNLLNLPLTVKDQFLWIYRLHVPDIALSPNVVSTLAALNASCRKVVILTDGRSISQRRKLAALGLTEFEAYISEEWGSVKPDSARFLAIMRRYPGAHYAYVADNPNKDFVAPNQLGWKTIGVRDRGRNIHTCDLNAKPLDYRPGAWIDCFADIIDSLSEAP